MVKIMFFDLDDTLLRPDKSLSPATKSALQKCKEKGVKLAIATARSRNASRRVWEEIEPDILILNGGAMVYHKDELIYERILSAEAVGEILRLHREYTAKDGQAIITAQAEQYYWNEESWSEVEDPKGDYKDAIYNDFSDFHLPCYKITAVMEREEDARSIGKAVLECDVLFFRGEKWRRFAHKEATKLHAVQAVCERLQIPHTDTMAFGDDFNDMEMLEFCGIGVAMGNAMPAVKAVADVVIGTNNEDGIAHYLEDIWLKNDDE